MYVEPENSDALTAAILRLHADADLRAELGCRGRAFIEQRFTRRAKAIAYLSALQSLTTAHRPLHETETAAC
jgi:glycosyltransferase involved in cell wall biosynthesis